MNVRKRIGFIFLGIMVVFVTCVFLWNGKRPEQEIQKQTRFLMDTYCTIQIPGSRSVLEAIDAAFTRMEEIDVAFNVLNTNSPLYAFNQQSIPISDEEIVSLIDTALTVSRKSQGAFDVTVYPLVWLWGFFENNPHLPEKAEIENILSLVGYDQLILENHQITKSNPNVQIDLGGIAKGYAVGEAVKVLREHNIQSALIDAGGDIYALGKLKNKPWKVGIRNPRGEGVIAALDIDNLSVVTSGDYERFFEEEGVKYHHLLDPKTGYPARDLTSVTVVSSNPTLADAWSTALFILGKEKGLDLVERTPDLEALMVTSSGEIVVSSGLK